MTAARRLPCFKLGMAWLMLLGVAGLLSGCGRDATDQRAAEIVATAPSETDTAAFLAAHWARPLARQGKPPAGRLALETSLDPAVCSNCHPAQGEDWRRSRHARAVGPGLLGQLGSLGIDGLVNDCLICHAPLAEQALQLRRWRAGNAADAADDLFAADVRHGLSCAGCHVREHRRYGPAPRRGNMPPAQSPHGGFIASAAFEDSRFCAACHQFEPDGPRIAGKLLEDTFGQWQASRFAREGRACQDCHMPARRHLWRGIHDPEMVRAGVGLDVAPIRAAAALLTTALTVRNDGVGHHFPTYVTPRITVSIVQLDARNRPLDGTEVNDVIGWAVPLDLSRELFDTRIPAGASRRLDYTRPRHAAAQAVRYRVRIEPDAFYAGFYRALLADREVQDGRAELAAALAEAEASPYDLLNSRIALPAR